MNPETYRKACARLEEQYWARERPLLALWLAGYECPSSNKMIRATVGQKHREQIRAAEHVKVALCLGGGVPGTAMWPLETARIRIVSRRRRKLDPDRLYLNCVVDGLVKAGVLRDDRASILQALEVRQGKPTELGPGTEVWLWEGEDGPG